DADWLAERAFYLRGDFDDISVYERLAHLLTETDEAQRTGGNYLFYLATPPQAFATIPQRLAEAGLAEEKDGCWRRVIVEKPFGTDLRSARDLNRTLLGVFAESKIYSIDIYLSIVIVNNIKVY